MGVDREREGRKVEDPVGGLATGLGGRRRWAGRPWPCVGNVTGELFPVMFSGTHTLENPFSPWVSENPSSFIFLG
jgi:hypothetical protein